MRNRIDPALSACRLSIAWKTWAFCATERFANGDSNGEPARYRRDLRGEPVQDRRGGRRQRQRPRQEAVERADQDGRSPCLDPAGCFRLRSLRARVAIPPGDDEGDEPVHRLLDDVRRRRVGILEPTLDAKHARQLLEDGGARDECRRPFEQLAP